MQNLLSRLGDSAATLVSWEFFTIDGRDIARVCVEASDHPVYEAKKDEDVLWWRYPQSTKAIRDDRERDKIIASRWSG